MASGGSKSPAGGAIIAGWRVPLELPWNVLWNVPWKVPPDGHAEGTAASQAVADVRLHFMNSLQKKRQHHVSSDFFCFYNKYILTAGVLQAQINGLQIQGAEHVEESRTNRRASPVVSDLENIHFAENACTLVAHTCAQTHVCPGKGECQHAII